MATDAQVERALAKATGIDPARLWKALRNKEVDEDFLEQLAIQPGVYRCTCCYDGCSYCNGTGEVIYMSGDATLDAPLYAYIEANYGADKPKIITQRASS